MRLIFLGTRGNIEAQTERHRRHSALMVSFRNRTVMIDCGEDWSEEIDRLSPLAIVITHAHPDHAWGLRRGAPCPVYATAESWEVLEEYEIRDRRIVEHRRPLDIQGMTLEAFSVDHSTRAPAVGYRVTAGEVTIFYVPDVVWIHDREEALRGANLYIGDGSSVARSLVRKSGGSLIGHTPIRTQLTWCRKESVPRAIFTHCGSEIVQGDEAASTVKVQQMAQQRQVDAQIAYDGLEISLP